MQQTKHVDVYKRQVYELTDDIDLDRKKKHNIELIVDRLIIKEDIRSRLAESIEISLKYANNLVVISTPKEEMLFSQNYACPDCNISIEELSPRMFSFNNPFGACPECTGIGYLMRINEDLVIPDKNKTLYDGVKAFGDVYKRQRPVRETLRKVQQKITALVLRY